MTSTNLIKTSRRRTFSLEDPKLHQKCEDGTLKKSLSSTIKIPTLSSISNCDLSNDGDNFDSLEDLNKEIENLCPFIPAAMLPHVKIANMRYCDIFSRQSTAESDENSSPDDEERINFLATFQQTSGDVLQLIPKKPVISSEHNTEMYQPCTNTTIQLKPSSFSAFRSPEISNMTYSKPPSESDKKSVSVDADDDNKSAVACSALTSHTSATKEDSQ